jgi:hypothetical protein
VAPILCCGSGAPYSSPSLPIIYSVVRVIIRPSFRRVNTAVDLYAVVRVTALS